jgi:hypothetical protein
VPHAENKLTTTVYHGEMKRFNWEHCTCVHVEQHAVLQGMMEYGYAGIDEQTKVWYLLAGSKTSALTPCTANLMATPDIRNSFDQTAGAIKDFINHMKSNSLGQDRDVTVASVSSNVKSGSCNHSTSRKGQSTDGQHVKPDMAVEDQYYSQHEYVGLSAVQKLALKLKRSARPSEKKKLGLSGVTLSKRSIKALSLELLTGRDAFEFEVEELSSESSCGEAQTQK